MKLRRQSTSPSTTRGTSAAPCSIASRTKPAPWGRRRRHEKVSGQRYKATSKLFLTREFSLSNQDHSTKGKEGNGEDKQKAHQQALVGFSTVVVGGYAA